MLTSVFAFALAICACAAQSGTGYAPHVQYTIVPTAPSRNLHSEVAQARSRAFALGQNDVLLNGRLNGLQQKIDSATEFRDEFNNVLLPRIDASMDAQDARIRSIRQQLLAQSTLVQDVDALQTKVDNLIADLIEIREVRVTTLSDIQSLEDADLVAEQQISDLETQVQIQDARVVDAEQRVRSNEAKADEVYSNLLVVVGIINSETATAFDVELTAENPTVSFQFDVPFTVDPGVHWGITGFNIEDDPAAHADSYPPTYPDDESLYTQVNVEVYRDGGTATLVDSSEGWTVRRMKVRISVYTTNSDVVEYQGAPAYV